MPASFYPGSSGARRFNNSETASAPTNVSARRSSTASKRDGSPQNSSETRRIKPVATCRLTAPECDAAPSNSSQAPRAGRCERCFGGLPSQLLVSVKGAPVRTSWRRFAFTNLSVPALDCGRATMDGLSPWKWSRLICAARDSYFLTGDSTGLHRLVTAFALFTLHSVLTQSV